MISTLMFIPLLVLALGADSVKAENYSEQELVNPEPYYHERVGIPMAIAVMQAMNLKDGKSNVRIIGGVDNEVGKSPYLGGLDITLTDGNHSLCGSSLLSNTRSLTAAHCWFDGKHQAESFLLVHGSATIYYDGVATETKNVTPHEDYDWAALTNDIAMIIHPKIEYTDVINKIDLPSGDLLNNEFVDLWGQAVGYGRNASDKSGDIIIEQPQRIVDVQVMKNSDCKKSFGSITPKKICTRNGPKDKPVGTCQGDSGGPLSVVIDTVRYLIGITSYGDKICEKRPSVYTRVTAYIDWITARM